ncbi:hypothetical protein FG379_002790 [Cryptosporidium bovis]|uniref:uncharacterized protein n=1 Tax=Cryptosporidium bovis TaxID=310047 RepID=UPI00351AAB54|nr:hypothetical protein FG379_002790 [Cryptosporidium bovis]
MEILEKYLKVPPFLRSGKETPVSRFGINENMVPMFTKGKKGVAITANKTMRFRYLSVKDNIAPIYPEKLRVIREKIDNIPLTGEFNLREEIKKVKFKEVQEEIEAVEYEVIKEETEEIEQPCNRGEYLSRVLQGNIGFQNQVEGIELRGFRIQGSISADSKVQIIDTDENKSYNPIKYARWYKSTQIFLDGDQLLYEPSPVYEGFEWKITRECIGLYLNVIVFRGNYIYNKCKRNILQARDLHFNDNVKRKLDSIMNNKQVNSQMYSEYNSEYGGKIDSIIQENSDMINNFNTEEITIGPVLIPDYIAYHVLNFICEESLTCNIILLDRPRDTFSNNDNEDEKKSDSEETKKSQNKQSSVDYKKGDNSGNTDGIDNKSTYDDVTEKNEDTNKTAKGGEELFCDSDNNNKGNYQDEDDYCEEDDYLAYRRKEYEGIIECQLMDGYVKISYNTEKDKEKERIRIKNANNDQDKKMIYRKAVQLDFDQFYVTIDNSGANKSIVRMIIFESENNSYEIKFRIDPKFGRDVFYYSVIAFQKCYQEQKYDWDDNLKNGDIIPIKEYIQDQLEYLSLKGFI